MKNNAIAQNEIRTNFVALSLSLYSDKDELITSFMKNIEIEDIEEEQDLSYTFETPDNEEINYCMLALSIINLAEEDGKYYVFSSKITNLQLEKGKTVTNWMPSQTDFYTKVEKYSKIIQNVNQIQLTVGTKVGKDEIISSINMSSEAIKINADKIELSANNVLDLISGSEINLLSREITLSSDFLQISKNGSIEIKDFGEDGASNLTIIDLKDSSCYSCVTSSAFFVTDGTYYTSASSGQLVAGNDYDLFLANHDCILLTYNGNIVFQATESGVLAPAFNNPSLESLKKNFEKLEDGLSIIKATDIYKYNYKTQSDGEKKHIGFIIGDKYKYSSEITSLDINKEEAGADLYSMVSASYRAIQQLDERLASIERRKDNG